MLQTNSRGRLAASSLACVSALRQTCASHSARHAVVELAEFACNDVGEGIVPINDRATAVAAAMAQAVAEVEAECIGRGDSTVTFTGTTTAEATAEAVGRASARVVVTSGVCDLCNSSLTAFAEAVETVTVTAVAEASIMVSFDVPEHESLAPTTLAASNGSSVQRTVLDVLIAPLWQKPF